MVTRRKLIQGALGLGTTALASVSAISRGLAFPVERSEAEWRKKLTPAQFAVLRQSGTERPFSSALLNEHRRGVFGCAGCDRDLFGSETKFDSGTGWPSFFAPLSGSVAEQRDTTFGMTRTAVECATCGGHLGHVFNDGPKPTGLRYCMNGVALTFRPTTA